MSNTVASKAGNNQADTRPGGSDPVRDSTESTMNPVGKTFQNSVRLVLDSNKLENRKISHRDIYSILNSKFGANSAQISNISGIGKGPSGADWIISYKNEIPPNLVDETVSVKNKDILIEDASKTIKSYDSKRLAMRKTSLLFRVTGFPLDVDLNLLIEYLKKLGYGNLIESNIKQDQISNFKTELVKFRIDCPESVSERLVQLSGNKEITLEGFKYKINISCYGFCFSCKKSGHTVKECPDRENIDTRECFFCKERGHLKINCPERAKKRTPPSCSVCKGVHAEKVCPFEDKNYPLLPNSSAAISNGNSVIKSTGLNTFMIAKEGLNNFSASLNAFSSAKTPTPKRTNSSPLHEKQNENKKLNQQQGVTTYSNENSTASDLDTVAAYDQLIKDQDDTMNISEISSD